MGYYLLDNPNPHGPHFYSSRRGSVLACVVHITAGLEDLEGEDSSNERVTQYAGTTSRAVSWHSGSDTDSQILLLPDTYTAFHCRGYNSRTIGHEISKRHTDWSVMPSLWVSETLEQAADCLRPRLKALKIPLRHASKAELDKAINYGGKPVGLIDHSRLDPSRRSDPGANFPWARFLSMLAEPPVTPPSEPEPEPLPETPTPEEDMKHQRFIIPATGQQYLATPTGLVTIKDQPHLALLRQAALVADGSPIVITPEEVTHYGVVQ